MLRTGWGIIFTQNAMANVCFPNIKSFGYKQIFQSMWNLVTDLTEVLVLLRAAWGALIGWGNWCSGQYWELIKYQSARNISMSLLLFLTNLFHLAEDKSFESIYPPKIPGTLPSRAQANQYEHLSQVSKIFSLL